MKKSQDYISFYRKSFYSPYLSALYPWKLAWWHGVDPLLECEHIFLWALESDLWSCNQWIGICHMCPAGATLSWTGDRIYSRSDSTLFEEDPLPYWEALLQWALEFQLQQPCHTRHLLEFEVSVMLHSTHCWYSLGQRGSSYSSMLLSYQTSSSSWEVSSSLVWREGIFSPHFVSRLALDIIEQHFPHNLGLVYSTTCMPKLPPHFISRTALEDIEQNSPQHLGVVYYPPCPYLGELKMKLLLFDDDNGSENKK